MSRSNTPIPIAVFASGRGSGFDALVSAIKEKKLNAKIVALVCNRANAPVIQKAKDAGITPLVAWQDEKLITHLKTLGVRWLVLSGYMKILTESWILNWQERGASWSRIVNIHPSLLPAFPGIHSYQQAFDYGCKVAGVTVHLVEPKIDSGPICAQIAFDISDCQNAQDVETRGLAIEHTLYPQTLSWLLDENFNLHTQGERLHVIQKN